jgi:hypothetical protein
VVVDPSSEWPAYRWAKYFKPSVEDPREIEAGIHLEKGARPEHSGGVSIQEGSRFIMDGRVPCHEPETILTHALPPVSCGLATG